MEARIVQSFLARNRDEIRFVEECVESYKFCADEEFRKGDPDLAYRFVKYYRQKKMELAKLVDIRKALKAELREIYSKEAEQRFYDSM